MKQIIIFFLGSIIFVIGCGEDNIADKNSKKAAFKNTSISKGSDPTKHGKEANLGILSSSQFQQFKKDFEAKYGDFNSLSVESLYQILEFVPEQTAYWSCGKVQSSVAQASASISLELALNEAEISQCNILGEYPLFLKLDEEIIDKVKKLSLLTDEYRSLLAKMKFEKEGNKSYFKVGALPSVLADYLNGKSNKRKLPEQIEAIYIAKPAMDSLQLVKMIDETIKNGMPLIALYVNPDSSLHYYSIVGHSQDKVLLLETTGVGLQRIKDVSIDEFLQNLNTKNFKDFILQIVPFLNILRSISSLLGISPEQLEQLPRPEDLEKLATYNLITFKKS